MLKHAAPATMLYASFRQQAKCRRCQSLGHRIVYRAPRVARGSRYGDLASRRQSLYDVGVIRRSPSGGRDLMRCALTGVAMAALLSTEAFSQSADSTSAFALADVHVSPRSTTSAMRVSSRAGRYEIRNATMV